MTHNNNYLTVGRSQGSDNSLECADLSALSRVITGMLEWIRTLESGNRLPHSKEALAGFTLFDHERKAELKNFSARDERPSQATSLGLSPRRC